jgi:4-nitrophenyl phosphatase
LYPTPPRLADLLPIALVLAEKRVLFATNNGTRSRRNYKFDGLGIEAHVVRIFSQLDDPDAEFSSVRLFVLQGEVLGSAYATAVYRSSVLNFPMDKRVYVIGMSGLEDKLRSESFFIGSTVSRHFTRHFSTRISFAVAGSCR